MEKKKRLSVLLSMPLSWLTLFFLLPFCILFLYSFKENTYSQFFPLTLNHYEAFFANEFYISLLLDSTLIAFLTAVFSIILAYPLAYYLVFFGGKRRRMLLSFLIIPAWTSFLLRILAWKVMLGSGGVIGGFLNQIGLVNADLPQLLYSKTAVVITLVYIWIPYAALPIYSALERLDMRLIEASLDLGANRLVTFLRITLPLSTSGLVAAFFFVFIPTLGEWVTPSLVGGVDGIMFGNLIQNQFLRGLNWPLGIVMSIALMAIVGLSTLLLYRFVSMREMSSIA